MASRESRELIHGAVLDRLQVQIQAIERVETKGTFVVGFAVISAQFAITALLDQPAESAGATSSNTAALVTALVSYLIAFLSGLFVVAPFRHAYAPDPTRLFEDYWNRSEEDVIRALTATRATAFGLNVRRGQRKTRAWWLSLVGLLLGVFFSAAAYYDSLRDWTANFIPWLG